MITTLLPESLYFGFLGADGITVWEVFVVTNFDVDVLVVGDLVVLGFGTFGTVTTPSKASESPFSFVL